MPFEKAVVRSRPPGPRVLLALALLAASACGAPRGTPPPLTRLLPLLGAFTDLELAGETRPSTLLALGEPRSCTVGVPRNGRLRFSVGLQGPLPAAGVQLRVAVDGSAVFEESFATDAAGWKARTIDLPAPGPRRITFTALAGAGPGGPTPGPAAAPEGRGLVAIGAPRVTSAGAPRGRVLLWISQDTLRADHLGRFGYSRSTSPAFDRLSNGFVVFSDATATAPWTLPSLASQFTGRYPSLHGAVHKDYRRDPAATTVFQALAGAGFTVLGVTGNSYVSAAFGLADGFDGLWYIEGPAAGLNHGLRQVLREWDGGDLAVFVHYMDPHYTYSPPAPYDRRFGADYRGRIDGANFRDLKRGADPRDVERVISLYDGEIAYADESIDRLVARLSGQGLLDDAVIVYSSDHGDELLDHGGWYHGHTLYRELLHVPLAIRVPHVPGTTVRHPISMVDLGPTLLEALGVPIPASFQGTSLLDLARGGSRRQELVFAELQNNRDLPRRFQARKGNLAYTVTLPWPGSAPPHAAPEELYDLSADPGETQSLASSQVPAELREPLLRYVQLADSLAGRRTRSHADREVLDRLKALGYLDAK